LYFRRNLSEEAFQKKQSSFLLFLSFPKREKEAKREKLEDRERPLRSLSLSFFT
jgi:hypothetical protein